MAANKSIIPIKTDITFCIFVIPLLLTSDNHPATLTADCSDFGRYNEGGTSNALYRSFYRFATGNLNVTPA
jgi:hypothetical protein